MEKVIPGDSIAIWDENYNNFYPLGSRIDVEFRFTRQAIMTARKWTSFIDEAIKRAIGHPRAHWQTLFALAFRDGVVTTLELSESLGVRWPTLIRTLNELEELELIVRHRGEDDRRCRLVGITDKGMGLVFAVKEILDPVRSDLLRPLRTREMLAAEEILMRLQELVARASAN